MSGFSSGLPVPLRVTGANIADAQNRLGTSFYTGLTINGVQTIVAPASNVNGLILRSVNYSTPAGYASLTIHADTVAPLGVADTNRRLICGGFVSGVNTQRDLLWMGSLLIPAGWGVWIAANGAALWPSLTWDAL